VGADPQRWFGAGGGPDFRDLREQFIRSGRNRAGIGYVDVGERRIRPAAWRNFSFTESVQLQANTDYWLVISSPTTVSALVWWAPDTTPTTYSALNGSGYAAPTSLLRANSTDGSTWTTATPAEMGFQLSAVAVPEPSAAALAAVGLGLAGLALRFRRPA
jgi:hypothetical protein